MEKDINILINDLDRCTRERHEYEKVSLMDKQLKELINEKLSRVANSQVRKYRRTHPYVNFSSNERTEDLRVEVMTYHKILTHLQGLDFDKLLN